MCCAITRHRVAHNDARKSGVATARKWGSMARRPKQNLTALAVKKLSEPGRYADGDGLYLQVGKPSVDKNGRTVPGSRSWLFLFQWHGKRKEMGLGSADTVDVREARDAAADARKLVDAGKNPIVERKVAAAMATPKSTTEAGAALSFKAFGLAMIDDWAPGWKSTPRDGEDNARRSGKQKQNWQKTVTDYAAVIADVPIGDVGTDHVMTVLKPLWLKTPEVARKTRRRIEKILGAARVAGHRSGDNPARWDDHLEFLLPAQRVKVRHHPSMPFNEIPDFLKELRQCQGRGARALELVLFTLVRTSEVIYAEKREFEEAAQLWRIPPDRMKGNKAQEHVVPLVRQAVDLMKRAAASTPASNPYIFGRLDDHKPLSTNTMDKVLHERLKYTQYTVHGFRSSFRDWAGDETDHDENIAEMSLAHATGDATELAYRRSRALAKRRRLLQDWADFIDPPVVRAE